MNGNALPRILTIAGSDSGGGAGIQADLKTIAALGGYGMAAITAITAQNTVGVFAVHELPPDIVARQIAVVLEDLGADAAKTGMLSSVPIIEAIVDTLEKHPIPYLVVDPVMVAKSGDALLVPEASGALVRRLLPLAYVVTPNIPEAEAITGMRIHAAADLDAAAAYILALGPRHVLMKGGHLEGNDAVDVLYGEDDPKTYSAPRIATRNTHGTGCTFSAAIATLLGSGIPIAEAVRQAKDYLTGAIAHALPLGHGHGPLDHGWRQR